MGHKQDTCHGLQVQGGGPTHTLPSLREVYKGGSKTLFHTGGCHMYAIVQVGQGRGQGQVYWYSTCQLIQI